MPDDKEKQQGKMVDIDTSGPGTEVSIPEEKKIEDDEIKKGMLLLYFKNLYFYKIIIKLLTIMKKMLLF